MLVFEFTIAALAALKIAKLYSAGEATPHLLAVMLRDSVVYFGGLLVLLIPNLVVWEVGRVRDNGMLVYILHSLVFL